MEIYIMNNDTVYQVDVTNLSLSFTRVGVPGVAKFSVICDKIEFALGDVVKISHDGSDLFLGFIFSLNQSKNNLVNITAYDQLRYLKNKDTYVYENKTASQLLCDVAGDFNLKLGEIQDTLYKIPYRVEDNNTLFDILQNALDLTFQNTLQQFVLFDDCGKLSVKNIMSMIVNIVVCEDTIQDYVLNSSIDKDTFNKIKLIYENNKDGVRNIYIAQGDNKEWGVLQLVDTLKEGENGVQKAVSLLALHNKKSKKLTINNAIGDTRIRAGSLLIVDMKSINLLKLMMVESVTHSFNNNEHFMKLTLVGGEFVE